MKTFFTTAALKIVKITAAMGIIYSEMLFSPAQQLNVTTGASVTAQQMVDSLFDNNFAVSNIVETANSQSRGIFTNNGANLGIQSGVVFTSGKAADCAGPNLNVYGANTSFTTGSTPDADLLSLLPAGSTTKDLCKIELDIIPYTDTLILTYSFASEEYLTYSPPLDNSGKYNDVFGFFISGAGISGTQNIALIPGTADKVSVCNINPVTNALYYIDNLTNMLGLPGTIEYNGLTKVMTAKIPLQQGQVYHVKIAIADVRDSYIDSGVFIKADGTSNRTAALPVNFTMVNAMSAGVLNKIIWKTASEYNCEKFEVEKSINGSIFIKFNETKGAGNTSIEHSYTSIDNAPAAGVSYYRIKQVDLDGNFTYSRTVMVQRGAVTEVKILSVASSSGTINIQVQSPSEAGMTAEMVDASGKVIARQSVSLSEGTNDVNMNVYQIPAGLYFIQFANDKMSTGFQKVVSL